MKILMIINIHKTVTLNLSVISRQSLFTINLGSQQRVRAEIIKDFFELSNQAIIILLSTKLIYWTKLSKLLQV